MSEKLIGLRSSLAYPVSMLVLAFVSFLLVLSKFSYFYLKLTPAEYISIHNIAEFFSVAVSFSIFGVGWFSAERSKNYRVMFLSICFLSIGLLDLMHLLTYPGMPSFFTDNTTNKSSQFWIVARLFSGVVIFVSCFINEDQRYTWWSKILLTIFTLSFVLLVFVVLIYYPQFFPATFIEGVGLTPFKVVAEYVVVALMILGSVVYAAKFITNRKEYLVHLIAALVISSLSEISFTLYKNPYDLFNLTGHLYKVLAFWLIYLGLFKTSVEMPYRKIDETLAKLKTTAEELEAYFNSSEDLFCVGNNNGLITRVNTAWKKTMGYSEKDFRDTPFMNFVHPEDVKKTEMAFSELVETGNVIRLRNRFRTKYGNYKWIDWSTVMSSGGKVYSVARDVTDQVKAETDLREIMERDKSILRSMGDAAIACDIFGKIILVNKMAEKIMGYSEKDSLGEKYFDRLLFVYGNGDPVDLDVVNRSLLDDKEFDLERDVYLLSRDGERIPVDGVASPIHGVEGKISGGILIIRDLRSEKSVEKAKNELVYLASHQLRTPLTSIGWNIEILDGEKYGSLNEDQKKIVKDISEAKSQMTSVINTLVTTSRLEMGIIELDLENVDLINLIRDCLSGFELESRNKNIDISTKFDEKLSKVRCDSKLMAIMVNNLVSNAIKYGKVGGKVEISLKREGNSFVLGVADDGAGISVSRQRNVFDKFFRGENANEMNPNGIGLGLYITKRIAGLTGGEIEFISKEGKGSRFWIKYPLWGMKSIY